MALVEDLTPFFTDFADVATIGGASVSGIFDNGYAGSFAGLVDDTDPAFTAPTAAVSTVVAGTSIVIGGTTYTVARVEDDGTGVTRLVLK